MSAPSIASSSIEENLKALSNINSAACAYFASLVEGQSDSYRTSEIRGLFMRLEELLLHPSNDVGISETNEASTNLISTISITDDPQHQNQISNMGLWLDPDLPDLGVLGVLGVNDVSAFHFEAPSESSVSFESSTASTSDSITSTTVQRGL